MRIIELRVFQNSGYLKDYVHLRSEKSKMNPEDIEFYLKEALKHSRKIK